MIQNYQQLSLFNLPTTYKNEIKEGSCIDASDLGKGLIFDGNCTNTQNANNQMKRFQSLGKGRYFLFNGLNPKENYIWFECIHECCGWRNIYRSNKEGELPESFKCKASKSGCKERGCYTRVTKTGLKWQKLTYAKNAAGDFVKPNVSRSLEYPTHHFGKVHVSLEFSSNSKKLFEIIERSDEIAKKEDCKAMIDYLSKSKTELKNLTEQKVCFWKSHRLFGVAFLENPDPSTLIQVDHINDDKYDYSLNNLRWLSVSDNIKDSRGTLEKKDSELF